MFKNIVPILLVLAALAGTGIGACASAYTISGCDERVIDLMADYPTYEFVGLDYRTSVIDVGDETFFVYPTTGAKIAKITDDGNGVFTFTPISGNKASLYFKIEKNGIVYTRYAIIRVLSNCPQETCDYEEYVAPGASCYVSMTTPLVMGESVNANIQTDGNGKFNTIITYGGFDNNGDVWNGVYPVVVELWEDDGNGLGFQLNASATLDCE